jgi:acetyl-CoA C-acetyltransferase
MDVAIIGAHTVQGIVCLDKRLEESVFEAASGALADAGITRQEVGSVVLGANDELDGRSISSMLTSAPAGGLLKDVIKTTDSGLHALALAAMRVQSGLFDLSLAVSWSKPSEVSVPAVQRTALDPFFSRDIGLIDPIASAVMASAYLDHFDHDVEDLDRRAAHKRSSLSGGQGPAAAGPSDYISYPLRHAHVAPFMDGAAAVVLASRRTLESIKSSRPPVWISGLGWATDKYSLSERTLFAWPALKRAASDAFGRARCLVSDIGQFEVDDYTVLHEVLAAEALGLAAPGTGFDYLGAESDHKVNRQCNGFEGYPLFYGGLRRLAAVFRRVIDAPRPGKALVHGTTGIAAQGHVVAILSSGT